MVLYFLIFFSIVLFLIGFYILGQDLFQPSCIVTATYILSLMCCYINKDLWGVELHTETAYVICSGLVVFFLGNLIGSFIKKKWKVSNTTLFKENHVIIVDKKMLILLLLFQVVALVIYYREIVSISGGGNNFSQMMTSFRANTGYSAGQSVSMLAGQFAKVSFVIAQVFIFVFLKNTINRKANIQDFLPVAIYFVQAIFTGGRFNILVIIIEGLLMYNVLWHKKNGWTSKFRLKTVMLFVCLGCGLLIAFYWLRVLVGRQNETDIVTYIASYAGGSIQLLDMYLQDPIPKADLWGRETFYSLLGDLKKLGIIDFEDYISHLEFRSAGGVVIGNVYTAFRRQMQDFGYYGMLILQFLWSFIITIIYNQIKKSNSSLFIIFYSIMSYSLFLHSINDSFYSSFLSIGTIVTFVMMTCVWFVITRVKIIFK